VQINGDTVILGDGVNFIEADYEKTPCEIKEAADFAKGCPEAIELLVKGIINGDENGNLRLFAPITRAEVVAMIARAEGWSVDSDARNVFSDTENHWSKAYVSKAVGRGIISGYGDSMFMPDAYLRIDEAWLIIFRLFGASEEFINENSPGIEGMRIVNNHLFHAKILPTGSVGSVQNAVKDYVVRMLYNYMHTDATMEDLYAKNDVLVEQSLD